MISSAGVEPIVYFHGNINVSVYKELLGQLALPHLCKGTVETPLFMQDNVPCHKAKTVLRFLEEEGIARDNSLFMINPFEVLSFVGINK